MSIDKDKLYATFVTFRQNVATIKTFTNDTEQSIQQTSITSLTDFCNFMNVVIDPSSYVILDQSYCTVVLYAVQALTSLFDSIHNTKRTFRLVVRHILLHLLHAHYIVNRLSSIFAGKKRNSMFDKCIDSITRFLQRQLFSHDLLHSYSLACVNSAKFMENHVVEPVPTGSTSQTIKVLSQNCKKVPSAARELFSVLHEQISKKTSVETTLQDGIWLGKGIGLLYTLFCESLIHTNQQISSSQGTIQISWVVQVAIALEYIAPIFDTETTKNVSCGIALLHATRNILATMKAYDVYVASQDTGNSPVKTTFTALLKHLQSFCLHALSGPYQNAPHSNTEMLLFDWSSSVTSMLQIDVTIVTDDIFHTYLIQVLAIAQKLSNHSHDTTQQGEQTTSTKSIQKGKKDKKDKLVQTGEQTLNLVCKVNQSTSKYLLPCFTVLTTWLRQIARVRQLTKVPHFLQISLSRSSHGTVALDLYTLFCNKSFLRTVSAVIRRMPLPQVIDVWSVFLQELESVIKSDQDQTMIIAILSTLLSEIIRTIEVSYTSLEQIVQLCFRTTKLASLSFTLNSQSKPPTLYTLIAMAALFSSIVQCMIVCRATSPNDVIFSTQQNAMDLTWGTQIESFTNPEFLSLIPSMSEDGTASSMSQDVVSNSKFSLSDYVDTLISSMGKEQTIHDLYHVCGHYTLLWIRSRLAVSYSIVATLSKKAQSLFVVSHIQPHQALLQKLQQKLQQKQQQQNNQMKSYGFSKQIMSDHSISNFTLSDAVTEAQLVELISSSKNDSFSSAIFSNIQAELIQCLQHYSTFITESDVVTRCIDVLQNNQTPKSIVQYPSNLTLMQYSSFPSFPSQFYTLITNLNVLPRLFCPRNIAKQILPHMSALLLSVCTVQVNDKNSTEAHELSLHTDLLIRLFQWFTLSNSDCSPSADNSTTDNSTGIRWNPMDCIDVMIHVAGKWDSSTHNVSRKEVITTLCNAIYLSGKVQLPKIAQASAKQLVHSKRRKGCSDSIHCTILTYLIKSDSICSWDKAKITEMKKILQTFGNLDELEQQSNLNSRTRIDARISCLCTFLLHHHTKDESMQDLLHIIGTLIDISEPYCLSPTTLGFATALLAVYCTNEEIVLKSFNYLLAQYNLQQSMHQTHNQSLVGLKNSASKTRGDTQATRADTQTISKELQFNVNKNNIVATHDHYRDDYTIECPFTSFLTTLAHIGTWSTFERTVKILSSIFYSSFDSIITPSIHTSSHVGSNIHRKSQILSTNPIRGILLLLALMSRRIGLDSSYIDTNTNYDHTINHKKNQTCFSSAMDDTKASSNSKLNPNSNVNPNSNRLIDDRNSLSSDTNSDDQSSTIQSDDEEEANLSHTFRSKFHRFVLSILNKIRIFQQSKDAFILSLDESIAILTLLEHILASSSHFSLTSRDVASHLSLCESLLYSTHKTTDTAIKSVDDITSQTTNTSIKSVDGSTLDQTTKFNMNGTLGIVSVVSRVIYCSVRHRTQTVRGIIPSIISTMRRLLQQIVIAFPRIQTNIETIEKTDEKQLYMACTFWSRAASEIVRSMGIGSIRYSAIALVLDYIFALTKVMFPREYREALVQGIYAFLDVLTSREWQQLHVLAGVESSAPAQLKNLRRQYETEYKFTGQV